MNSILRFIKAKQILLLLAIGIVGIILWNTFKFFKEFQRQEIVKMEILADAYFQFNKAKPEDDISLLVKIIENNTSIPMLVTDDKENILLDQNIYYETEEKNQVLKEKLKEMKSLHPPIEINISETKSQYIYYSHSEVLNKLRFYPLALVLIFIVFLFIIYAVFNASSISEKNKLWSGMAKETAHQIGTPLSSLLGWVEILRTENVNPTYVSEIEKDVEHLNIIANRFSKIGSKPKLELHDPSEIIENTIKYFKIRTSKNIVFNYNKPFEEVKIMLNKDLFGWVLENIIKNAIDAMQGKGNIDIQLINNNSGIQILITDTGKGIPKNLHKKIFEPGFTTKTRGWGLGLSLTKRIINKYHKGKIFVKQSQKHTGSTFQINIPK
ncbi:HAMP domain-containing sensor histidine kinase [Wenyingzhuangia sp. chi5]|uniref:histidine kinase n=1 Tax=Wenyingzhuangia gilva TaxID=3057677 RepID=A0ABT8VPM4_9FLAO|nr:HAMP domain-containing sensor histidine kinase [Wenyingzhuangia sp. chi5]MDO3693926.1 HAMP domain-containing sensor histidine kinase [Wenyingzhuangia sp. chi5]